MKKKELSPTIKAPPQPSLARTLPTTMEADLPHEYRPINIGQGSGGELQSVYL